MKKPSLRIHFRRICSVSGSGSPMLSAEPASRVRGSGRLLGARASLLPGAFGFCNGYQGNRRLRGLSSLDALGLLRFVPYFNLKMGTGSRRGAE